MDKEVSIIFPKDRKLAGSLIIPGSKSISNRFLILNFLSGNKYASTNLSTAEDTKLLLKNLEIIEQFHGRGAELYCHHGGAPFRFLLSLLSVIPGEWKLDGSERLRERPHADLLRALRALGAKISGVNGTDVPPFIIKGNPAISGGTITLNASVSSQIISSLLLIGPLLKKGLVLHTYGIRASESYIDMTIKMMKDFGIEVIKQGGAYIVNKGNYFFDGNEYNIESDWSSASYIFEWLALSDEGQIKMEYFIHNSIQPDSVITEIFKKFGIVSKFEKDGTLFIKKIKNFLLPEFFEYDFTLCPDIAQTVAVTCFVLRVPFYLTGLHTLNSKECERLNMLGKLFKEINGQCEFNNDSILIKTYGSNLCIPDKINTYLDHRMAMSLSGLAFLKKGLIIENANVTAKSYPSFWIDLSRLGVKIQES